MFRYCRFDSVSKITFVFLRCGISVMVSKGARAARKKPKRLQILRKSKHMRQWLLRNPWVRPMCVFNYAAIKIQQHIRGCLQRMKQNGSKRNIVTGVKRKKLSNRQLDKYLTYLDRFKDQKRRRKPLWLDEGYSSWCAVRIQSFYRMHQVRKRYVFKKKLVNQVAAIIIQTAWRNCVYRMKIAAMMNVRPSATLDVFIAAEMIQLCWRSFCNRRIYRYFRDLVTKNLKGAPFDLLRSIIPTEAHVLDRASGVHVRFRLGGRVYPPKVYFKIYTHRPLCDVNSFAPRNYVLEKPADPAQVLNRSSIAPKATTKQTQAIRVGARYFGAVVSTTSTTGTKDWYKRDEKNDWRPIASHMFDSVAVPPWYRDPAHSNKPKPFHFSKLRREEDIRLARKKRRRQWLVKAYLISTTGTINAGAGAKTLNYLSAGQKEDNERYRYAADEKDSSDNRYYDADAKSAPDGRTITNNYRQLIVKSPHGGIMAESKYGFEEKSSFNGNDDSRSAAADFKRSFGTNYERPNDQRSVGSASLQLHSRVMTNASESLLHSKMSNLAPFTKDGQHQYSTAQKLLRTSYALDEQSISTAGSRVKTNTLTNAQQLVGGNISYSHPPRRPLGQAQPQPSVPGQGAQTRQRYDAAADHYVDLVDWSMALNFDEYTKGWGSIGTSMPSDAKDSRDKY